MTPIAYPYLLSPRAQESAVHGPVSVHSAGSRSAITPPLRVSPSTSTDFSDRSSCPTFCSPLPNGVTSLDRLFPAIGNNWASMVNTLLLPMFKEPSSSAVGNNNNATCHGQTVDPTAAKFTTRMAVAAFRAWDPRSSFGPLRATCTTTPAQFDRRQQ